MKIFRIKEAFLVIYYDKKKEKRLKEMEVIIKSINAKDIIFPRLRSIWNKYCNYLIKFIEQVYCLYVDKETKRTLKKNLTKIKLKKRINLKNEY